MRQVRVKQLRKFFVDMYASACEEAKTAGEDIIPQAMAWRIFKKMYLKQPHG
jgi:hypothetical protein